MAPILINCPHCGLTKEVPRERIPEGTVTVTCPRCRNAFPFAGTDMAATSPVSTFESPKPLPPASGGIGSTAIPGTIGEKLQPELEPGEVLLWAGQPRGGFVWSLGDIVAVPFTLVWLGGALYIASLGFSSPFIPFFMKLVFSIFVAIGVFINMRKFFDKWNRENTWYGLTDRNIIIVGDFRGRFVNRFPLKDLGEVRLFPGPGSRGSISFGLERYRRLRISIPSLNYRLPVNSPFLAGESPAHLCFYGIEDAEGVYQRIETAWRNLCAVDSKTTFPDSIGTGGIRERRFRYIGIAIFLLSLALNWHQFSKHLPEVRRGLAGFFDKGNAVAKPTPPADPCAEWIEGLKAEQRVAEARSRHPEYPALSPAQAHAKGLEHDRRGEVADAIVAWESEVAKNPRSVDGWNDIGYAYQRLGNPLLALEYASRSTAENPNFGHGHYTAGRALLVMGRFAEAEKELRMAVRDGWQQNGDAQLLLGLALRGLGDEQGGKAALGKSLEIRPDGDAKRYLAGEQFRPTWPDCAGRSAQTGVPSK